MRITIGVMGSAGGLLDEEAASKLETLGRAIAEHDCILITGGCPGLPYAAVQGAKEACGMVVGISPGLSLEEYVLTHTGSGLMGREIENIHSSDIVVIVGGRSGTLGEFAIAYDEGRLIGVLTGSGGIADAIADLVPLLNQKPTGAVVLYDDDPGRLIEHLVAYFRAEHSKRPNCFCQPVPAATS